MASGVKGAFAEAMTENRRLLNELTAKKALPRLKRMYDAANDQIANRLHAIARGELKGSFTHYQAAVIKAQLREGQIALMQQMARELGKSSKEAQKAAAQSVSRDVARLAPVFRGAEVVVPVVEASRFAGAVSRRETSLLRMHRSSMANYGARLVGEMEDQLGESLISGENTEQAIERIRGVAQNEWWQGERIARTEISWAFNGTRRDGFEVAAEEIADLFMRWTEHCDDLGSPLDDRVGDDSIALHGQLARPGGRFVMPAGASGVSQKMWGDAWMFPPNRPNDRAVLLPWRRGWGIPGWLYEGGQRIDIA